mgnify:FL=1
MFANFEREREEKTTTNRSVICLAKVRRLYDIANVLSTINLITKVIDPNYRGPRPAFQYIGPRTEIIHHAESMKKRKLMKSECVFFLDVVDFINSENTKSNSKHSLFDHFKRNLFLNCTIPRFDPRNGLLGLKSALDMNGKGHPGVYSNHLHRGKTKLRRKKKQLTQVSILDEDIQRTISMENSPTTQHSSSYIPESSTLFSEVNSLCLFTFFRLEKRKYSKHLDADNQQKSILVASMDCNQTFSFLIDILLIFFYLVNNSSSSTFGKST